MAPSKAEVTPAMERAGLGRWVLITITSDLLLDLAYCEGDGPTRSFVIEQARDLEVSDLELLDLLLAVSSGTGRHQILRQYLKENLSSSVAKPENMTCWNEATLDVKGEFQTKYAIAIVGDSTCMFSSTKGQHTETTVATCVAHVLK